MERARRDTSSQNVSNTLSHLVRALEKAIADEHTNREDDFQARTCLGWLYWTVGDSSLAVSALPTELPRVLDPSTEKPGSLRGWTYVCLVRSTYIRCELCYLSMSDSLSNCGAVIAEEAASSSNQKLELYQSTLTEAFNASSKTLSSPEYRLWTERLLISACMFSSRQIDGEKATTSLPALLAPFRAWGRFWQNTSSHGRSIMSGLSTGISRRRIWLEYYNVLSQHLRYTYAVKPDTERPNARGNGATELHSSSRSQQIEELKRVEATYEDLLLKEVAFPKANEVNPEVDHWVNQVMSNWREISDSAMLHNGDYEPSLKDASKNVLSVSRVSL